MRVRQLDLVRALAVLLVLGRHTPRPELQVVAPLRVAGQVWYDSGWIGVDLFFVLSGFLVSGLFFTEFRRHGDVRAWRFLVRRGFKIYPPFYVMLLATLFYYRPWGRMEHEFALRLRNEALFVRNYMSFWGEGLWNHTWSLDAEEHFYFVLAALVTVLVWVGRGTKDPFRPLAYLMPLAAAAVLGSRVWSRWEPGVLHLYLTHMRADGLVWGVFLAYWYHCRDRSWLLALHRHLLLVLLAAGLLLAPPFVWWFSELTPLWTIGLASMALGFTAVLILVLPGGDAVPRAFSRPERVLARIGADSYSIYLWHMPVSRWLMPPLETTGWFALGGPTAGYVARSATFVTICVVVGILAALLVERPSLALRDWLFPSRSGALAVEPARGLGYSIPRR